MPHVSVEYIDAPAWTASGTPARLAARPQKHDQEYLPTWEAREEDAPSGQERALEAVAGVEGLMYPEDALKLYELAWFASANVLEIGTFKGRSAAIMGLALKAAGNPAQIISVDVEASHTREAGAGLAAVGVADRVLLVEGTAPALLRRLTGFRPGLVYVDGDHTYHGVRLDLEAIEPVVPDGGLVLLHDYEGYAADDPFWVQVAEAAHDSWLGRDCVFAGRFGLSGVFVRTRGGPGPSQMRPLTLHVRPPDARASRAVGAAVARAGASLRYRTRSWTRRGRGR